MKKTKDKETSKLKVLIIEDNPLHLHTAKRFAEESGHEVTVVSTLKEAQEALRATFDGFFPEKERKMYDVVLTDLYLKTSIFGIGHNLIDGLPKETPYGFIIALFALMVGVKNIGVLTDADRHKDALVRGAHMIRAYKSTAIGNANFIFSESCTYLQRDTYSKGEKTLAAGDDRIGGKAWEYIFNLLIKNKLL